MKTTEIDMAKVKDGENPLTNAVWIKATKEQEKLAYKILEECVIGVNLEKLKSHHDFLPSIFRAMKKYKNNYGQVVKQF